LPRGRPRIPTKLHVLRGIPGKRPLPEGEPQPEVKIPEPPAIIQGVALEEWHRITKELFALGLVAEINRSQLAGYCKAYADWIEAEWHWDTEAHIYKTETGYPVVNPWRNVADKAFERMTRVATGFGMDPASMSRIKGAANPNAGKEKLQGAKRFLA
jgi:P27 family predicted phage terminase small subunit